MNDLRPVLHDDAVLDLLALGERPEDAGAVEDLLLALRADSLLAVAPPAAPARTDDAPEVPTPAPSRQAVQPAPSPQPPQAPVAPVPAPRVLRVRSTLAGGLVAAAVLAGTSGVAAAVTGDPFAGMSGVRDAVLVATEPEQHPPLLRSPEGAELHRQVERVAALLAAGRLDEARALAERVASVLGDLSADEQDLLVSELVRAAPQVADAAGVDGTGPGTGEGSELLPGDGASPSAPAPGAATTAPGAPAQSAGPGAPAKTTKPSKPSKTPPPGSSAPAPGVPAPVEPSRGPGPTTDPPPSAPPSTTSPGSGGGSSTTSPTKPGGGPPATPGKPTKSPKPPKAPKPPKTDAASTAAAAPAPAQPSGSASTAG